ncbi:ArsR family transcriptional regulator [Natrononativus amylolyticus]|uniref:ArsR family transcriptional regulator n=1 Tax=Natrononativus amylolyticus TaxID=2963434 RepID=UPI0020CD90EC|nr:ArsR family transcriptional regulator [Natrononativus amylolyticus]
MKPPGHAADDEPDTWHVLQAVTSTSRANILADIVGHPKGAPSVDELSKTNPSLEKDTIRGHLSVLRDVGVVEELTIPAGERTRGYPYKFYRLTRQARELFDANGLFPEDAWKRQYDRLTKDAEMRELERMPRPVPDPDTSDDDRSEELTAD